MSVVAMYAQNGRHAGPCYIPASFVISSCQGACFPECESSYPPGSSMETGSLSHAHRHAAGEVLRR